jgi:hypothetical protein
LEELSTLRLYKTNAESEHKILLEELAKRRLKQKSLRKKVKKLEHRLFEYQNNEDLTDYVDHSANMRRRRSSQNGIIKSSTDKTGSETEIGNESSKVAAKKRRPQSGHSAVSFQETDCSDMPKVKVDQCDTTSNSTSPRKRPQSGYSVVSFQESVSDAAEEVNTMRSARRRPQSGYSAVSFQETICATDTDQNTEEPRRRSRTENSNSMSSEGSAGEESRYLNNNCSDHLYVKKPEWNKSTATTLLSQNAPPSVIWDRSDFDDSIIGGSVKGPIKKTQKHSEERHNLHDKLSKERSRNR